METIPAPPGTYLLEREQGATEARKIPVLGFLYVQQGPVYPLCAIAHSGLTRGRVLVTADGFVTDPSFGVVCGNVDEWMVLSATPGYWAKPEDKRHAPAKAAPAAAPAADEGDGEDVTEPRLDPSTAAKLAAAGTALNGTPAKPAAGRLPDKPKGKPQNFQTTSFWRVAGQNAIFIVEGGVDAPAKNDTAFEKIKRDDYQALKKAGAVVRPWPLVVDDDAADAGEAADEDDDGSGLI